MPPMGVNSLGNETLGARERGIVGPLQQALYGAFIQPWWWLS
ncbi:hypothetical protein [uncultured Sphingomonas sp.]